MFINIDENRKPQKAKYYLAKPNKQVVSHLHEKFNDNCSFKLGNVNELNLSILYFIEEDFEMVKNKNIDLIKEKMLIKMVLGSQVEWFIIDSIEESGDSSEIMNVTAFSLSYELTHKSINGYSSVSTNARSFLEGILTGTVWKIGTIDTYFENIYRSFDEISNSNVLDVILQGGETFGALIDWNTIDRKVSFLDLKTNGKFKGMTVNYGNLLNKLTKTRTTDEMVTRLYIYGSDDLTIHSVNPTGMGYLENFSYFMYPFERDVNKNIIKSSNFMTDALCNALLDHQKLLDDNSAQMLSLRSSISTKQTSLITEKSNLDQLNLELDNILNLLDVAQSAGDTVAIAQRKSERDAKKSQITAKQAVVDGLNTDITSLNTQLDTLISTISISTTFTQALLDELNLFIIEKEWRDDRYINVQELYDDGVKKFQELREPKVVLSIDLENLLEVIEEQYYWDKLVLGDYIKIKYPQMNIQYMAKIIEINYDFESGNIQLTIANATKINDENQQLKDILYGAKSASTLIENNKAKWDKVNKVEDDVYQLINNGIDANKRKIIAGIDNKIEIGKRGITITSPSNLNDVVILQSGIIALSKDKGESWRTAIKPDGIIADTLIGNVLIGRNLVMTNTSGKFTFNENGVIIDGASLTITSGLPEGQINNTSTSKWNSAEANAKQYSDSMKLVIDSEISDVNGRVTNLNTYVDNAFKDGVIDITEKEAIITYLNQIDNEKADIDSRYTATYNDAQLSGTPKTNLLSDKTAYDTAHTNLKNSINTAISDNVITQVEKDDVNAKFVSYRTSLSALSTRFEEAIKSIAQVKANTAETSAKSYADTLKLAVDGQISDVNLRVTNLNTYVDGSFEDGVIEQSEAKAIEKYINSLTKEKADIDSQYTSIYGNISLLGTAKTNLATAKTSYDTAHTNLINSINTAITDGKTTTTEKADVDTKFTSYKTALGTLSTRFSEAIDAIAIEKDRIVKEASVGKGEDLNGVKIDGIDGIKVTSTKNTLTMNASKGIEIKKTSDSSNVFSLDAVTGNLTITGNINMTGGSITWGAGGVNSPTPTDVGARPSTWTPTASDVGARANTWTPTASDVGARPSTWMPTATEVGARANTWMPTATEVGAVVNSQNAVFNALTNNGSLQGLYMSGGNLYINANYISTGYISANLINGGQITGVTINVSTDLTVGNNVYVGTYTDNTSTKYINFNGTAYVKSWRSGSVNALSLSASEVYLTGGGSGQILVNSSGIITLNGTGLSTGFTGNVNIYANGYTINLNTNTYIGGTLSVNGDITSYGNLLATQSWVNGNNYLTSSSLSGYATQSWVSGQNYSTYNYNSNPYFNALQASSIGVGGSYNGSPSTSNVSIGASYIYVPQSVYAKGVQLTSSREYKKNIVDYTSDALYEINTTPIREYHMLDESDTEKKHVGIILQEAPVDVADIQGHGVDLYAMVAMSWKAIQQLSTEIEILKNNQNNDIKRGN